MKQIHEEITQTDIKFWLPIIATVVTITVWGMALSAKLDVNTALLKETQNQVTEHALKTDRLAQALNDFATRLVALETLHGR